MAARGVNSRTRGASPSSRNARRPGPPVLAISGPSGSGKTWLLVRLIPALIVRGLKVAALKHSGHEHPLDKRGKDSARLRDAGAEAVIIQTPNAMALFGPPRESVDELVALLPKVDLVLVEGWKSSGLPKIEVHRRSVSREFLCESDRQVLAIATDERPPRRIPAFDADDVDGIAHFVVGWFAEGGTVSPRKRAPRGGRRRPARASR
ncbi:MAG TPA: molybdopterin-guanine dinucleotide biosynthesis protein B [Anaeromyxobacteraceae bacterium]|nr:molybdopterin-guanine dinucleotide biosynthesis protein B [Anaeromyxobacteraceae bacterium]